MAVGCKLLLLCLWMFYHCTNLSCDDEQVQGDARNVFVVSGRLLPVCISPVAVVCTFRKSTHLQPWKWYRPALTPPFCYWLLLSAVMLNLTQAQWSFRAAFAVTLSGPTRHVSNVMCVTTGFTSGVWVWLTPSMSFSNILTSPNVVHPA